MGSSDGGGAYPATTGAELGGDDEGVVCTLVPGAEGPMLGGKRGVALVDLPHGAGDSAGLIHMPNPSPNASSAASSRHERHAEAAGVGGVYAGGVVLV